MFHFPLGFICINFFSILLEEEEGEAVMVMFNTKMRGQDQTGEKVNPDITDEEAPLIMVCIDIFTTINIVNLLPLCF